MSAVAVLAGVRTAIGRQLRDLPPGRRLRLRLARDAVEAYAGGRSDVRLLDAGSEEGLLCLALARRHQDWQLVAADLAAEPLERGRRWACAEGLPVHYLRCNLEHGLGRGVYDVVVSLESLVEIPDDRAALRSITAALRPGGLLVVQLPTRDWTPVLRGAERRWRREARHGYDPAEFAATLDDLGLDVREIRPTFHRAVALAQDVRDRFKRRGRLVRLLLLPIMAGAVSLERAGLSWGAPRAFFVVAVRR